MSVETPLETDLEALKRVLNVETCFEERFEGANEKFAYMRILILGKKKPAQSRVGKIFYYRLFNELIV